MTWLGPSSRVRSWKRSDGEGGPAAAGRLDVGVDELEAGALEAFDVVDRRAGQVLQAHRIDDQRHAERIERAVGVELLVEVEIVGEPRAAAANHAQTQPVGGLDVF